MTYNKNKKVIMKKQDLINLEYANKIAQMSKDESTKVGVVFFDENGEDPLVYGYNGLPRGFNDKDPNKTQRPEKYFWFEHAERNAIYNLVRNMLSNSHPIAILSHFPNMEGARALVISGIEKIIVPASNIILSEEEKSNYLRVKELCSFSNTELIELDPNKTIVHQDKYQKYLELVKFHAENYSYTLAEKKGVMLLNGKTFTPIKSGMGASRIPEGIKISDELISSLKNNGQDHLKSQANFWILEPEKDAIFKIARSELKNKTAYVSWCPCAHCGLAIAAVGIKEVTTHEPDFTQEAEKRWQEHFSRTMALMKELNIPVKLVSKALFEHYLSYKNHYDNDQEIDMTSSYINRKKMK